MISVIIPNYNNARYLENAIQSILNQTFSDYEIIVVDDGSTDNSREVVTAFGDKVRYIWQENKGLGGARNTGILASNAEFIGLLDADDEWKPDYLKKMMLLVYNHPDAAVYYSGAQGIDSSGAELPQIFGRKVTPDEIYADFLRANFIIPSTVIFRRAVILDIGLFDEKNRDLHGCEDWDLWLRLAPSHQFAGTAEPLVRYRLHAQTFSANSIHMQKAARTVIEKNFGEDDGNYADWSREKKRAFGGMYRYRALSFLQKQGNWDMTTESLRKAFEIDPTLAFDIDLFYELAFGIQVPGYRETTHSLNLEQNARQITNMLANIFDTSPLPESLRRKIAGTVSYAIGLVAYNTNQKDLSRRFLARALVLSPNFLFDKKVVFTLIKSYLHTSLLDQFRRR